MTRWGMLLLLTYVAFGLTPVTFRKATRLALGVTVVLLAIVMAQTGGMR
jgi:hypothetical protein